MTSKPCSGVSSRTGGRPRYFCRTRLIEVLLHLDDLAASVGVTCPDTSAEGRGIVIDILIGIARLQHGDWPVLHALARDERRENAVFPVF